MKDAVFFNEKDAVAWEFSDEKSGWIHPSAFCFQCKQKRSAFGSISRVQEK